MWISADLIGRTERYPHPPTPLPLSARSLVHERLTNAPSVCRSGFFFVAAQHKSAFVQSFSVTRGFPVTKKSPGVVQGLTTVRANSQDRSASAEALPQGVVQAGVTACANQVRFGGTLRTQVGHVPRSGKGHFGLMRCSEPHANVTGSRAILTAICSMRLGR